MRTLFPETCSLNRVTENAETQDRTADRVRVALIFGGVSSEHGVSCLTAASVASVIDTDRFEIVGVGITTEGAWVSVPVEDIAGLVARDGELPQVDAGHPRVLLMREPAGPVIARLEEGRIVAETGIDVAFSLLHGPFGEDGTIQGMFEMLGVRYIGSGVAASANGMDKHLMKTALADAGLPIGPYTVTTRDEWQRRPEDVRGRVAALDFPVFVKPARGGSSVGISRVRSADGLDAAMAEALTHDPKVVIESGFVGAREIECAVLGAREGEPRASEISEIIMHVNDGFYDFESKYNPEDGDMELAVPADLAPETADAVRRLARWTFTAMGAEGLARVDCFLTAEGELYVNEINTMPGMTQYSGYPKMWEASGLPYRELVSELLDLALDRPLGLR